MLTYHSPAQSDMMQASSAQSDMEPIYTYTYVPLRRDSENVSSPEMDVLMMVPDRDDRCKKAWLPSRVHAAASRSVGTTLSSTQILYRGNHRGEHRGDHQGDHSSKSNGTRTHPECTARKKRQQSEKSRRLAKTAGRVPIQNDTKEMIKTGSRDSGWTRVP